MKENEADIHFSRLRAELRGDSTLCRTPTCAEGPLPPSSNFPHFLMQRTFALDYGQSIPPVGNQLLLHEHSALAALMLYHHRSGSEFAFGARDYAELRSLF